MGRHRVLCGNALCPGSYESLMGYRRARVVFVDPPRGFSIARNVSAEDKNHGEIIVESKEMTATEFTSFLSGCLTYLKAYSLPTTIHYICADWRHMKEILSAAEAVYSELKDVRVWVRYNARTGSLYRSRNEMVFVFEHRERRPNSNVQLGRLHSPHKDGANSVTRPSSKRAPGALQLRVRPVALVEEAIMDCSARGDVVVDPFLGSGTSLIAAERTGIACYGLEPDPANVDTAIRRLLKIACDFSDRVGTGQRTWELVKEVWRER
jgi:hypothetical protein